MLATIVNRLLVLFVENDYQLVKFIAVALEMLISRQLFFISEIFSLGNLFYE